MWCLPISIFAQDLKGVVKDLKSKLPIADAQVITQKATFLTNNEGKFTLSNVKIGESIAVRIMGYETVEIVINNLKDSLYINLMQTSISLNEIEIKTSRNYKFDSLAIRKEYAKAFAYKAPSVMDMFIEKDSKNSYVPSFINPRSTASIISLNLVQVAKMFGKKKIQSTKLKQTLIRDEQLNYVDEVFSKRKVKLLTGLEGEALVAFMNLYRPSLPELKKMTGYEITIYIKKSYKEYQKKTSATLQ